LSFDDYCSLILCWLENFFGGFLKFLKVAHKSNYSSGYSAQSETSWSESLNPTHLFIVIKINRWLWMYSKSITLRTLAMQLQHRLKHRLKHHLHQLVINKRKKWGRSKLPRDENGDTLRVTTIQEKKNSNFYLI